MACSRSLHYYSLSLMQSGDTLGLACLRGGLIPRKTHLATQMSVTETHMFSLQFARNLSDFEQASLDPELSLIFSAMKQNRSHDPSPIDQGRARWSHRSRSACYEAALW